MGSVELFEELCLSFKAKRLRDEQAMMVALGKEEIKSLEDFAGCAADDLVGWSERKDGETKRFAGVLPGEAAGGAPAVPPPPMLRPRVSIAGRPGEREGPP